MPERETVSPERRINSPSPLPSDSFKGGNVFNLLISIPCVMALALPKLRVAEIRLVVVRSSSYLENLPALDLQIFKITLL
jgi:hypothetical protein